MLSSSTTSRSRAAQRGGGIIIDTEATTGILSPDAPEEENFKQLINQIWKNSFTKYELIPSDSTGGFLYKITLAEPESRYFKKLTAFNFEPVRELLLKVVIISENKGKGPQKKRFSKAKDFIEESFIQSDVYNQTYDAFLEPICPFILLSQIVPNADLNRIISYIDEIMTEENKEFVEKIREISGWNGMGLDVGFIFMEYLEGSFPLSKYFPAWNSNNYQYENILDESSPNDQIEYLKLYIYELVRLWMAGYIHDDTHLDNAMYIANPDGSPKTGINYIYNKRLYLIDFGHAEKHKEDINNTRKLIKRILPKVDYWSYSALKGALKEICEGGGAGGIPEKNFEMWYHEMTLARNKSKESYIDNIFKNPVAPQYKAAIKKLACAPPQAAQEITRAGFADIFETNGVIMRQDTIRAIKPNDDKKLKKPLRGKKYVLLLDNFTAPLIEVLIYYVFDKFIKARNDINIFYNRIPDIDGVYTFVVYKTANGKINTVCYKTHSFHEIATKHACVMYFENIVDYYSAGELKVEGANVYVNYLSGTYMGVLIKMEPRKVHNYMRI